MINYEIKKDGVKFSQDFSTVSVKFSYTNDEEKIAKFYGEFSCNVNWDGYFADPIINRLVSNEDQHANWLKNFTIPLQLNDLFYNKLTEYMDLNPESLEIDDKENITTNLYTDEQELDIYETLFSDLKFIEEFKDALNNPARPTLTTALIYFKSRIVMENKVKFLLKDIIRESGEGK
jgi:hypothetical protein